MKDLRTSVLVDLDTNEIVQKDICTYKCIPQYHVHSALVSPYKSLPYLLNNEHRRSSGLSPFQISVGLGSLGQGISLMDFDFDRTFCHHLE
jgi:hypothetical protein